MVEPLTSQKAPIMYRKLFVDYRCLFAVIIEDTLFARIHSVKNELLAWVFCNDKYYYELKQH